MCSPVQQTTVRDGRDGSESSIYSQPEQSSTSIRQHLVCIVGHVTVSSPVTTGYFYPYIQDTLLIGLLASSICADQKPT